jgi:hypothetical protein
MWFGHVWRICAVHAVCRLSTVIQPVYAAFSIPGLQILYLLNKWIPRAADEHLSMAFSAVPAELKPFVGPLQRIRKRQMPE